MTSFPSTLPRESKLKPVTDRRQVEPLYRPRWKKYLSAVANVVAPGALLVAGTVWTVSQEHPKYTRPAELMKLPGALIHAQTPTQEAFRIGQVLRRYTKNCHTYSSKVLKARALTESQMMAVTETP